jgi:hypothetical protein
MSYCLLLRLLEGHVSWSRMISTTFLTSSATTHPSFLMNSMICSKIIDSLLQTGQLSAEHSFRWAFHVRSSAKLHKKGMRTSVPTSASGWLNILLTKLAGWMRFTKTRRQPAKPMVTHIGTPVQKSHSLLNMAVVSLGLGC